jgi:hypothetical protein
MRARQIKPNEGFITALSGGKDGITVTISFPAGLDKLLDYPLNAHVTISAADAPQTQVLSPPVPSMPKADAFR